MEKKKNKIKKPEEKKEILVIKEKSSACKIFW